MTPKQYRAALSRLDLTQVAAAKLFGANERTSRYWALGERAIPPCVAIVLRLLVAEIITIQDVEKVR